MMLIKSLSVNCAQYDLHGIVHGNEILWINDVNAMPNCNKI